MQTYTLREVESMLGISRAVIARLVTSGFVSPERGSRREYRFSFQDVVLLRTAHELQRAAIAPRRILRSLRGLRARLPAELPLSGLRISAVGSEVAVRQGDAQWAADSGQLLLDFAVEPAQGSVSFFTRTRETPAEPVDWFAQAVDLEAADRRADAEAAYRRAIAESPQLADAVLNLGVLLAASGRHAEAAALYHAAIERMPDVALLHFNLGVAFEDLGEAEAALLSYEASLRLAPELADAHYNLARLHERFGRQSRAIRHFNAYRRLRAREG